MRKYLKRNDSLKNDSDYDFVQIELQPLNVNTNDDVATTTITTTTSTTSTSIIRSDILLIKNNPQGIKHCIITLVCCIITLTFLLSFKEFDPEKNRDVHYSNMIGVTTVIGGGLHAVNKDYPYIHTLHPKLPMKVLDVKIAVQSICGREPDCVDSLLTTTTTTEEYIQWTLYTKDKLKNETISTGVTGKLYLDMYHEVDILHTYYANHHFELLNPSTTSLIFIVSTNSTKPISFMFDVVQMNEIANFREIIASIILLVTYTMLLAEVMHRTAVALVGSFLSLLAVSVIAGSPTISRVITWMDVSSLALLFSMMVIVNSLSNTGVFQYLAVHTVIWSGYSHFYKYIFINIFFYVFIFIFIFFKTNKIVDLYQIYLFYYLF